MKSSYFDPKVAIPVVVAVAVGIVIGGKIFDPNAKAAPASPKPTVAASPSVPNPESGVPSGTPNPVAPVTPEAILASVPDAGMETASAKEVVRWKAAAAKEGGKVKNWVNLGDALMQRVRENGDHHYYGFADSVYRHALTLDPKNASVMTGLAWAAGGGHRFAESMDWAKKSIALDPNDPAPYGLISDAQIELGDLDGAFNSCQKMLDVRPDLSSYSRGAHLLFLSGDYRKALWLMDKAVKAGGPYSENTAWCRAQEAEMLWNTGEVLGARTLADAAMKTGPNNYHVNLIMGRVKEAQGDIKGATEAYKKAISIAPQVAALTALGDLYWSQGKKTEAEELYTLIEQDNENHLKLHNGKGDQLPIARFYADHDRKLDKALEIVKARTDIKNPVQMDTAAWVYYKNGDLASAQKWIDQSLKIGKPDAGRLYHAGMIYAKSDPNQAKKYLYKGMNLNPYFSPIQIPVAAAMMQELGSKPATQTAQASK